MEYQGVNDKMIMYKKPRINKWFLFLYLCILRTATDIIIIFGVIPIYKPIGGFSGDFFGLLLSYVFLAVFALISPTNKSKPSTWAYLLLISIIALPTTSLYWISNSQSKYIYIVLMFFITVTIMLHSKIVFRPVTIDGLYRYLFIFFIIYVAVCLFLIIKRGGIDSRAFDFSTIYSLRAEDTIRGFSGYLKNWCVKALFPFFFLFYYERKKYQYSALCITLQLLLYLAFGEKTTLFSIGLVICIYYVYKTKKEKILIFGIATAILIPMLMYLISGNYKLFASTSYRFIYIPSAISYNYYEFFSAGNPFLWLSETTIGRIFNLSSPYPITFSYFISGGKGMANTGVISDAYANGGIIMCFIFAMILGFVLLVYDGLIENKIHKGVIVAMLGYSCINLMDNGLLTSLLTNGMLLTILIAMMLPSNNKTHIEENGIIALGKEGYQ